MKELINISSMINKFSIEISEIEFLEIVKDLKEDGQNLEYIVNGLTQTAFQKWCAAGDYNILKNSIRDICCRLI